MRPIGGRHHSGRIAFEVGGDLGSRTLALHAEPLPRHRHQRTSEYLGHEIGLVGSDLPSPEVVGPARGQLAMEQLVHLTQAVALNYRTEDEQVAIARELHERLASVDHVTNEVHHPYPHPRQPGLSRDHQRR